MKYRMKVTRAYMQIQAEVNIISIYYEVQAVCTCRRNERNQKVKVTCSRTTQRVDYCKRSSMWHIISYA